MKNILILITLIFISCNSKTETKSESEVTYRMLIKENNQYNSDLTENIKSKIEENSNNREIVKYDSLAKNYLIYLSEIFNHSSIAVTRRYLGIRQEQLKDIYLNL